MEITVVPGSFREPSVLGSPLSPSLLRRQGPLGLAEPRVLLAQRGNALPPAMPSTSKTGVLVLYSPEFKDSAPAIAKLRFGVSDKSNIVAITRFPELASTIAARSPIGLLVLDFHGGTSGEIKVGDVGDEVGSPRVRKFFTKTCTATQSTCHAEALVGSRYCAKHKPSKPEPWFGPRVDQIVFDSCVVGQAPDQLASFGKLFHAGSVIGCTWFHVTQKITLSLPKGMTVAAISDKLKPIRRYLMAGNPSEADMAAKCKGGSQKQELWAEWWRSDFSEDAPKALGGRSDDKSCKVREELRKKTIDSGNAAAAAAEMKNELLEGVPHEVTVTISY